MSDWQERYRADMLDFLCRKGLECNAIDDEVLEKARKGDYLHTYGLHGSSFDHYRGRNSNCHLISTADSEFIEANFSYFVDTFTGNETRTYVLGTNFGCACGKLNNKNVFWQGNLDELLGAMIREQ